MKKIFTFCMILLIAGFSMAQNPFIRDDPSKSTYLKFNDDKTGFGTVKPAEKVTIQSIGGESNLGLKPAKNQSNSLIKFYNSAGVVEAELWVTNYGFIIGKSKDTVSALLVANILKHYLKINGSLKFTGTTDTSFTTTDIKSTRDSTGNLVASAGVKGATINGTTSVTSPKGTITDVKSTRDSTGNLVATSGVKGATVNGTTSVTSPIGTITDVKSTRDSTGNLVATSGVKGATVNGTTSVTSPLIHCTGTSGPVFTATDGSSWQLRLSSVGAATYVTVTP